ncbi:hypothetical protein [Geobacter benzoatilyticus]|uniref:Uncharacterized protein n=1 Tax=Geobacter benzoatilyticus TaxID=2815309 RepID=A0ABX7Q4A8_9BACT|nr:hypothetical protein [Geobacter benzoatilyticus]QSV46272.1 hypothetical protein JZM60_03055 [Geobacter benzoatilyticus]
MARKNYTTILVVQALAGITFVVAAWKSDRALDKSGIGDPERFTFWNEIAGISFNVFIIAWLIGVSILLFNHFNSRKSHEPKQLWQQSNRGVWLPPLLLFIGWLVCIL